MIYFCADDYGMSAECNEHIRECLTDGALNKVSVLPNGEITDFKRHLSCDGSVLSLHLNLIEGRPMSRKEDVGLLVSDDGFFKYSFAGLLLLSLSGKRKQLEKQIYTEIQTQIKFWGNAVGERSAIHIDSHQHTHMIPLVLKALMRVIKDEGVRVEYLRIPSEPVLPYLLTPSLYPSYSPRGFIKQWILNFFALINGRELKKSKIPAAYFMGVMFSGRLNEKRIKKLLPRYLSLARKSGKDIEICFHPGYSESGEALIDGSRRNFGKFYCSPWRKEEYKTLINFRF